MTEPYHESAWPFAQVIGQEITMQVFRYELYNVMYYSLDHICVLLIRVNSFQMRFLINWKISLRLEGFSLSSYLVFALVLSNTFERLVPKKDINFDIDPIQCW